MAKLKNRGAMWWLLLAAALAVLAADAGGGLTVWTTRAWRWIVTAGGARP